MSAEVTAVIAGSVTVRQLAEALARAGLTARHDGARNVLVIEPQSPSSATLEACRRMRTPAVGDALAGIAWFNGLAPIERALWLHRARSACPADAWRCFKESIARQQPGEQPPERSSQSAGPASRGAHDGGQL